MRILLLISFAVVLGFAHNVILRLLVYSAVSCFYRAGCIVPRWHELAMDALWFPATLLTQETLSQLTSSSLETQGVVVSAIWALGFLLAGFVVLSAWRARGVSGNGA